MTTDFTNWIQHMSNKTLYFTDKFYPDVEFVMLTGSMLKKNFVSLVSDIDVFLISKKFTGVSSHVTVSEGFKIDFTKIGFSQLYSLIIASLYDYQNILITMVRDGIVLRDSLQINQLKMIYPLWKQYGSLSQKPEGERLIRLMLKLIHNIKKESTPQSQFFILNDLSYLITSSHLYVVGKGTTTEEGHRRMRKIVNIEGNRDAIDKIIEVSKLVESDFESHKQWLISYIKKHISAVNFNLRNNQEIKSIFTIDSTKEENDFIRAIYNHPYLSDLFLYNQSSQYPYMKNRVLLVFNKNKAEYDEIKLLRELYSIKTKNTQEINAISSRFIEVCFPDIKVYNSLEIILTELSSHCSSQWEKGNRNKYQEYTFLFFLLQCFMMMNAFQLDKNKVKEISNHLYFYWLPNHSNSTRVNKSLLIKAQKYYEVNKETLKVIMSYQDFISDTEIGLDINKLSRCYSILLQKIAENKSTNTFTSIIYPKHITGSPLDEFYYSVVSLEYIANVLMVRNDDRYLIGYVLRKLTYAS